MDQVLGKLDDNSFIKNQEKLFKEYQLAYSRPDTKMEIELSDSIFFNG